MTKLAPEWVRSSDPVIRSPARYRWTTAPACVIFEGICSLLAEIYNIEIWKNSLYFIMGFFVAMETYVMFF